MRRKSLYEEFPDISAQWHPKKNGSLTPLDVTAGSGLIVWWICPSGHEYQMEVKRRALQRQGCPIDAGKQVLPEYSFAAKFPDLLLQWNESKNGGMDPWKIAPFSGKKVWWRCNAGHEWQAVVRQRAKGTSCPYCSNRRVTPDNSLAALLPAAATEWHKEKNGNLTPDDVTAGSSKRVWWSCPSKHEWMATVNSRKQGRGCPICSRFRTT